MKEPVIAIYSSNGFQETFTRAHRDLLPVKYVITEGTPPRMVNGVPMLPMDKFHVALRKLKKLFGGKINPDEPLNYFLSHHHVDVFIAEFGMAGAAVVRRCKECAVPLIVNFYGIDAFGYEVLNRFQKEYDEMFKYASAFNVQSDSIRARLIEMGCPDTKIVVNPGPPADMFFQSTATGTGMILVSVGRFVDKKAPHLVLMSFAGIVGKFPEARLVMVGDGPLLNACKQLSRVWGIEEKVDFVGRIDQQHQLEIMKRASVFVQHSVVAPDGDREGIPVSIMEASAMGIPIISTIHSGIPEVVEHGVTGILVPEFDVEGMRDAMLQILTHPDKAKKMGEKGREHLQASYSMKKHISILNELIQKAYRNAG